MKEVNEFLYLRHSYQGKLTPSNLMFDANLQEFSQRISLITALETGGKLSPEEAFVQVQTLWRKLKHSSQELGIRNKSA